MMTYPMVGKKLYETADMKLGDLELVNSLSEDASSMRPSLIPSVLNHAQLNQKSYEDFSFFEIGKVYLDDEKTIQEKRIILLWVNIRRASKVLLLKLLIKQRNFLKFKPPLFN